MKVKVVFESPKCISIEQLTKHHIIVVEIRDKWYKLHKCGNQFAWLSFDNSFAHLGNYTYNDIVDALLMIRDRYPDAKVWAFDTFEEFRTWLR